MATDDISRHLFRPEHHYTGVRMQQSRPLLDSDVNEGEMLVDEDRRAVAVEIIGPHGSSDDGFKIGPITNPSGYDFDIHAGSYWLGGLRHQIEDRAKDEPQRLLSQSDWLQRDRRADHPTVPAPPTTTPRHDLVYLFGWEQSVSAVEDPELLELALGGPDTSSRIRRMHRVLVRAGDAEPLDCGDAFDRLITDHTAGGHSFDRDAHELRSGARLTVIPSHPGVGNLCEPTITQGYTGAEVQAIRVHCIAEQRFLWGYDAAAPLYRIEIPSRDNALTITFLTPPRDSAHFPTIGQVIEILPWGAELENGEKVADHHIAPEIGGGVYARVSRAYDPASRRLEASVDAENQQLLDDMTVWINRRSAPAKYFYARVWNPGDDGAEHGLGVAFTKNTPVTLAGTGLELRFSGPAIPGDTWVLAARPSDPTHVVPWDLLTAAAPHGPRRFLCPLAMVAWTTTRGNRHARVHSCRRTFHPLTQQSGCCSVTVGDGETSHGDYPSITAALRAIPDDMPAKICVLPGVYRERVILQYRADIVIEGCGARTLLSTPVDNDTSAGLITITACRNITIRDLRIEATGQMGVMIFQDDVTPAVLSHDITLEDLVVTTIRDTIPAAPTSTTLWLTAGSSSAPLATVAAFLVAGLTVRGCTLTMDSGLSGAANILLLRCTGALVEACEVAATAEAWGGIHVGEGCEEIVLEGNTITTGMGHGVTFGSASTTTTATDYVHVFDPAGRFVLGAGSSGLSVHGKLAATGVPSGGGEAVALHIAGDIRDVHILGNKITGMGGCGVGVLGFRIYVYPSILPYEAIGTHDVLIADNRITDNYRASIEGALDAGFLEVVGLGGISLADADNLRIRDNLIADNTARVNHPVCGIYVAYGENVVVEDNHILDNGLRYPTPTAGIRAGIALQLVGRRIRTTTTGGAYNVAAEHLLPAARVRGNVVSQPLGRALQIYGLGPMLVSGNILVSRGLGVVPGTYEAHCVDIHNIGQSSELVEYGVIPANSAYIPGPALVAAPGAVDDHLVDGRILFTDNQVHFSPISDAETASVYCATLLQSHGDVAVYDNQFLTTFPSDTAGHMVYDTIVTAWSTRTASNRWEDPALLLLGGWQTETSALTVAAMNITTLNQATRCIEVQIASGGPTLGATNPIELNQTYLPCTEEEPLESLLEPP